MQSTERHTNKTQRQVKLCGVKPIKPTKCLHRNVKTRSRLKVENFSFLGLQGTRGSTVWRVRSEIRLTVSFRCSGNKSFSCAMHSLILSRLFFSISLCGNLYVSCGVVENVAGETRATLDFFFIFFLIIHGKMRENSQGEGGRNLTRIYLAFVPLHAPPGFEHINGELHSLRRGYNKLI